MLKYPTLRTNIPGDTRDYRRLSYMWRFPWEILDILRAMAPYLGYTFGHMLEVNAARMP